MNKEEYKKAEKLLEDIFENNIYDKYKLPINVPFEEKDLAKELGARWDGVKKRWFIVKNFELCKVFKWFPVKEIKTIEYKVSDKDAVRRYEQLKKDSRWKNGKEILKHFKWKINKTIFYGSFFCNFCDSDCGDEWCVIWNDDVSDIFHALYFSKFNEYEKLLLNEYLKTFETQKNASILREKLWSLGKRLDSIPQNYKFKYFKPFRG